MTTAAIPGEHREHDTVARPVLCFETIVDMLKENLKFVELRRGIKAIHMRQPGANVDLEFTRSDTLGRDTDKKPSQVSFLCDSPEADLGKLVVWAKRGD